MSIRSAFHPLLAAGGLAAMIAHAGVYLVPDTTIVLEYEINDGEATIIDCLDSSGGTLEIPATLGGASVTSIGKQAFEDGYTTESNVVLDSVIIPDSVTTIGERAFYYGKFTSVSIPDSVTSIGDLAFCECIGLTSLTVHGNGNHIGSGAFKDCDALTSVTLADGVSSVGREAFSGCRSLESVTVSASVTSIPSSAFEDCESLVRIDVSEGNPHYTSQDGVLFNATGDVLVKYPRARLDTAYTVPNGVRSIMHRAFYHCYYLNSVTIPDGVTSIGYEAFKQTGLLSLTLPDSVTSIGRQAFTTCSRLEHVTIPRSVTSIGWFAFSGCDSLSSVTFEGDAPAGVNSSTFEGAADDFTVGFYQGATGFTTPEWMGYPCEEVTSSTPGKVVLLEPSGIVETSRPTLRWEEDLVASRHLVRIQRNDSLYYEQWVDGQELVSWWDWENGDYTWSVQTWGGDVFGDWSDPMDFTVSAPPPILPAPTGLQPNAQQLDRNLLAFGWDAVAEAEWYHLYIAGEGQFYFQGWYDTHEANDWQLCFEAGSYSWYVQAWSEAKGFGEWSDEATFTVTSPLDAPGQPALIAPVGTVSDDSPVFTWSVGTDTQLTQLVIRTQGQVYFENWVSLTDTWQTWWDFEPGIYEWSCTGWNRKHGTGLESDIGTFTVE